jgi:hypothetical protein
MARLRIYTVHIDPSLTHPYESAEFVQEGFSFRAFVFSTLWALYYRLWGVAALLLTYNLFVFYMYSSGTLSHTGLAIIDLGVHVIIGFEANEWVRARLGREGYITADITTGDSLLRAEQRFFDRYFSLHSLPA